MKGMGGGGGSHSRTSAKAAPKPASKPKAAPRKMSHSQLVAKWEAQGGKFVETKTEWSKADIDRARNAKQRAEEAAAAAAAEGRRGGPAGSSEPEDAPAVAQGPKAHELAKARMALLAEELAEELQGLAVGEEPPDTEDELRELAECRRAQLQELEMVQAMFPDETLLCCAEADVEALRAALETLDAEAEDAAALRAVAALPPLELCMQLTADDHRPEAGAAGKPLVAALLLRVRFPPRYPQAPPVVLVEDAMVTDATAALGADKTLSTLAVLDDGALAEAMLRQAAAVLPDPCVYEMVTWMGEHAFEYMTHWWSD